MKYFFYICSISLGHKLRYYRQLNDLSQENVAHELGVNQEFISQIENNRLDPPLSRLYQLAELYKVDITKFFSSGITFNHCENSGSGQLNAETVTINHQFPAELQQILIKLVTLLDQKNQSSV